MDTLLLDVSLASIYCGEQGSAHKMDRVLIAGYRRKVPLDTRQKTVTGNPLFVAY